MAKITLTDIGVGTTPGDGTGDPARTGGQAVNSNNTAIENAINELASRKWSIDNSATQSVSLGDQLMCTVHSGVTVNLPTATAIVSDDYNHIIIANFDTNSNVSVDPNGSEEIFFEGATLGAGVAYTLSPGYMALLVLRASGDWNLAEIPMKALTVDDLDDVTLGTPTTDDVLGYTGTAWVARSREEADIAERDTPAFEAVPYMYHETRSTATSGTVTIDCATEPSVYVPIGGNNVTINLDVPALSLPVRGLNDVKLAGKVFVRMTGAYSGLTVTTDAGTKLSTFPKGTAPSASGEWAVLVWEWFDDGSTDFMWAEWVNDA